MKGATHSGGCLRLASRPPCHPATPPSLPTVVEPMVPVVPPLPHLRMQCPPWPHMSVEMSGQEAAPAVTGGLFPHPPHPSEFADLVSVPSAAQG